MKDIWSDLFDIIIICLTYYIGGYCFGYLLIQFFNRVGLI
jgi:hypothetical protein